MKIDRFTLRSVTTQIPVPASTPTSALGPVSIPASLPAPATTLDSTPDPVSIPASLPAPATTLASTPDPVSIPASTPAPITTLASTLNPVPVPDLAFTPAPASAIGRVHPATDHSSLFRTPMPVGRGKQKRRCEDQTGCRLIPTTPHEVINLDNDSEDDEDDRNDDDDDKDFVDDDNAASVSDAGTVESADENCSRRVYEDSAFTALSAPSV
ncbi:unnamed protein product [Phytophthora fragariaefolia]|uniref:Unnamed protein product n=1 Tax=Phytophthora fragariaefolia TaxID=1490495 RepID=A0A9W6XTV6_9STRA|nr:unnamed protein product [Phytophthora fragariaefolia]